MQEREIRWIIEFARVVLAAVAGFLGGGQS